MNFLQPPHPDSQEGRHPSRHRWDLFLMESLPVSEHKNLQGHLDGCTHCRGRVESLREEREHFLLQCDPSPFLAEIMQRQERQTPAWKTFFGLLLKPQFYAPLAAGLAAVVLFFGLGGELSLLLPQSKNTHVQTRPLYRAYGVKGTPRLNIFRFRKGKRSAAKNGGNFFEKDSLGFTYRSSGYSYLFMILLDAKGEISWLYPGKDASQSIPIAAQGELHGSIELDGSKGQEKLLTFFSNRPLSNADIRKLTPNVKRSSLLNTSTHPHLYVHQFVLNKP